MSGRLGRAAAWAACEGVSDVMVGWQPQAGSPYTSKHDPHCQVVPLEEVLRETRALLDRDARHFLHRDVGGAFYRVLPPFEVPWLKRALWRTILIAARLKL